MRREVWQSGDFRFAGGVGGSHHHRALPERGFGHSIRCASLFAESRVALGRVWPDKFEEECIDFVIYSGEKNTKVLESGMRLLKLMLARKGICVSQTENWRQNSDGQTRADRRSISRPARAKSKYLEWSGDLDARPPRRRIEPWRFSSCTMLRERRYPHSVHKLNRRYIGWRAAIRIVQTTTWRTPYFQCQPH